MGRLVCTVNCDGSVNGKNGSDLPGRLQHPSFFNSFKLNVCQTVRRLQRWHSSMSYTPSCILHISNIAVFHVNVKKSLRKQTLKFRSNYTAYLSLLMCSFFPGLSLNLSAHRVFSSRCVCSFQCADKWITVQLKSQGHTFPGAARRASSWTYLSWLEAHV